MARNLYILAATLLLFSAASCGMSLAGPGSQPGHPGDAGLWRTMALFLLLGALLITLLGMVTALFEQVDRRAREREDRERALGKRGRA